MSKYSIEESTLTGIADKLRTMRGTTGMYMPEQMAFTIQSEADLGKVKIESCRVTYTETTGYGLAGSGLNTWYVDPDGKLRHLYMGGMFQVDGYSLPSPSNPYSFDVAKNTIIYIENSTWLCPMSDASGDYTAAIIKSPCYILVIQGDTTFKFDYD